MHRADTRNLKLTYDEYMLVAQLVNGDDTYTLIYDHWPSNSVTIKVPPCCCRDLDAIEILITNKDA